MSGGEVAQFDASPRGGAITDQGKENNNGESILQYRG